MADLDNVRIDGADFAGIPQTGMALGCDGYCLDGLCGSDGVVPVVVGADGDHDSCISTRPACMSAGELQKGAASPDERVSAIVGSSAGLQKGDDGLGKRDCESRRYGDNRYRRNVRSAEGGKALRLSRLGRHAYHRGGRGIAGVFWSLLLFVVLNGSVVNATANEALMPYVGEEYLYMVSGNSLYVFNFIREEVFRVGEVPALTAMASHQGQIYMIGADDAALQRLNIETGTVVRVGSVEGFGVSEHDPENLHLTAHNNRLYMTGSATEALYIVNTETGMATRVGNVDRYGISDFFADVAFPLQGLTSYFDQLYVIGSDDALYRVDSETGIATRIGNTGISDLHGLAAFYDAGLYAIGKTDNTLYRINANDARAIRERFSENLGIGSDIVSPVLGVHLYVPVDQMETSGETLYMLSGNDIYSVNTNTGSATRVAIGNDPSFSINGLTFHNGMFYVINRDGLYTLDIGTVEIERVGSVGDFHYGLASHNGKLYTTAVTDVCCNVALYTVDVGTGARSRVAEDENYDLGIRNNRQLDLVSHNGQLYMMAAGFTHIVYTDTGRADRIIAGFSGRSASHNGSLYTISDLRLHVVDESFQTIHQVGPYHFGMSRNIMGNAYIFSRPSMPLDILPLASAILPASRSVQVNQKATVFATVINGADTLREDCEIRINNAPDGLDFRYFQTDATNIVTSDENEVVDIPAGGHQFYLIEVTSQAAFAPIEIFPTFICRDQVSATTTSGVNSVVLSVSDAPTLDIIAIALTPSNDGTLRGTSGRPAAFALASFNEGAAGQVRVAARGTGAAAALSMSICQTDMMTGQCIAGVSEQQAVASLDARESPTWSVFVGSDGPVPYSPAESRIVIEFFDDGGVLRGATSVAVLME